MDLKHEKSPLVILFAAYNALLAGVWVMRAPAEPVTPVMLVLHAILAFVSLGTSRGLTGAGVVGQVVHRIFPFALWILAWMEIGWLFDLTAPAVHDPVVQAVEMALLGIHPNQVLAGVLDWNWLRGLMELSYLSYYLLVLGPPLLLGLKGRSRDLEFHTFALLCTYAACFLVYLTMPVLGPRVMAMVPGEPAVGGGGPFGGVIEAFFAAGNSLGTAFPSSHCAGSVASALLVRRHFSSPAGTAAAVWAGLIVVSTVYTSNHYALDAAAGVAASALIVKLALLRRPAHPRKASERVQAPGTGAWRVAGRHGTEPKGGLS